MTSEPVVLLDPRIQRLRLINATRPAVNLPDESLAQIFDWVVHDVFSPEGAFHPVLGHLWVPRYRLARTRICATCWRWRHVAIAESSLWTKLLIHSRDGKAGSTGAGASLNPDTLAYDVTNTGQRMISLDMYDSQHLRKWDDTIRPALSPITGRLRNVGVTWIHRDSSSVNVQRVNHEFLTLFATPHTKQLCLRINSLFASYGDTILDLSNTIGAVNVHVYFFIHTLADSIPMRVQVPVAWHVKKLTLLGAYNAIHVIKAVNSCVQLEELMLTCDFAVLSEGCSKAN